MMERLTAAAIALAALLAGCIVREDPETSMVRAEEALLAGRQEEAKQLFLTLAAKDPQRRERIVANMGLVAARDGDLALAESRFRTAMEQYPDDPVPGINLAYLLYFKKSYSESVALLQTIIAGHESLSEAYNLLGLNSFSMGDLDGAEKAFAKALEVDSENHRALNNLAFLSLQKDSVGGDPLGLVTKALALKPENPAYIDTMGMYYFRMGMFEEARKQFNRAVKIGPDLLETREHFALLLEWMDLPDQAVREWEVVRTRSSLPEVKARAQRHLWELRSR